MSLKDLQQGETILKEENAIYLKGKINVQPGWLTLTNKRLVFIKSGNYFFGLIGMLFKSLRGGKLFNIPLNEIQGYSNEKYGLNKKVLGLDTAQQGHIKFALSSQYQNWEQYLMQVIKK